MSRYAVVVGSKEYRRTAYALCGHAADAIADIGVERATNGEMERRSYCGEMMDPATQSYIPVAPAAAGTHPSSGYSETCAYGANEHGVHRRRVHPAVECSLRIRCCSQYLSLIHI